MPPLPSLELVHQLIAAERGKQLAHFDSLDNKAGIVLGFSGLLIAVSPDVDSPYRIVGIVLAAAAAAAAVLAFWLRKFPVLDPTRLGDYIAADEAFTQRKVTDTLESMVNEASDVLKRKSIALRVALAALLLAAGALGVGILTTDDAGEPDGERDAEPAAPGPAPSQRA